MTERKEIPIERLTPEGLHEFILREMKKIETGERTVPKHISVSARLRASEREIRYASQPLSAGTLPQKSDKEHSATDPQLFEICAVSGEEMSSLKTVLKLMEKRRQKANMELDGQSLWIKYHKLPTSDPSLLDDGNDDKGVAESNNNPRAGGSCLIIKIRNTKQIALNSDGNFFLFDVKEWKRFVYYGGTHLYSAYDSRVGKTKSVEDPLWEAYDSPLVWTPSGYAKGERTIYPSTMKDLLEGVAPGECVISDLIMEYFAQANLLWGDLRKDFAVGSAYAAIPASEIWTSHSRQELIQKRFQFSLKRNNREPIGHGIFLARAAKMVVEEELEHLFGYNPGHCFISRKKQDMTEILSRYIYKNCPNIDVPMKLPHGRAILISLQYIQDALDMDVDMRKKISVTYKSVRSIYEWHEHNVRVMQRRELHTVKIPKNSIFNSLKMPPDCVRLKTRNEFIEEGNFQNNCVATYIDDVNADRCSIWSQRKPDGTRNTIEVCVKRHRDGRLNYDIRQMLGFNNSMCDPEECLLMQSFVQAQSVMR